jgi:hypothetical protein
VQRLVHADALVVFAFGITEVHGVGAIEHQIACCLRTLAPRMVETLSCRPLAWKIR